MGTLAPLHPVDLDGPSPNTEEYVQQLFAIQDGATVDVGVWPSEATNDADRPFAIVQQVAAILGSGRHWTPDPLLTCAQVVWAAAEANAHPSWGLNPVYMRALQRAEPIAAKHTGALPWATPDQPGRLVNAGTFGLTPVSGYYGTGHGTLK